MSDSKTFWIFTFGCGQWNEWVARRPQYVTPEVEIEVVR